MSFEDLGTEIGRLVDSKNAAYGDSFGKSGDVMRLLYPEGIRPDQYDDALGVIRVVDKLFRIATDRDAFGETPWRDVAGYGIRAAARVEAARAARRPLVPRCGMQHVSGLGERCPLDRDHPGVHDFGPELAPEAMRLVPRAPVSESILTLAEVTG